MSNLIDAKLEQHQNMSGSRQCPSCGHKLDRRTDWVGLPAGVKFDPTDQELIEHLESKVSEGGTRSHPLIDEFIPTIQGEDGICYTHPEKLPGVTKDGLSKHFFHTPSKAYTTGTRKRRKIQADRCDDLRRGETRWHKTGKTRPVLAGGRQRGCKKILVLYTNFGKHRRPEKTNWVMHQYHLGELEEEREGELVVSKIFYQTQPRHCGWSSTADHHADGRDATSTGGGGCSSSKEVLGPREDEADQLHLMNNLMSFGPFRKSFDEADATAKMHEVEERQEHEHHHHHPLNCAQRERGHEAVAAAAFHDVARPSNPLSTGAVISPASLHLRPLVLDDPFHISGMLLQQTDKFQQQQQPQHKLVERSSSGLEELIMGCTSAATRAEAPIQQPQETEWLKYSYSWSSDNQDHHG